MNAAIRVATIAVLAAAASAFGAPPEEEQVPFPVDRSQILRAEKTVYYIEGRQTIPKGIEISCQKDVYIKARGENATLVVAGSLQVHGVSSREVIFEGITIEPAREFEDIHLDSAKFRNSGGLRTPTDGVAAGKIFCEFVQFLDGTFFDVTVDDGSIDLSSVLCDETCKIAVNTPEGKTSDDVKIKIRGCTGISAGFEKGMSITGAYDVTVRINRIRGDLVMLADNDKLIFDGNKVSATRLELRQSESGRFGGTKLQKCDIYSDKLVAFAPVDGVRKDKIKVDKCWFKGKEREKDLRKGLIEDGESNPEENGARFTFKKINTRALELGGPLTR